MPRDYAKEYREYHSKPEQKKRRAGRNAAAHHGTRGKAKKGDKKDVHHKDRNTLNNKRSNLKVESRSKNRSRK